MDKKQLQLQIIELKSEMIRFAGSYWSTHDAKKKLKELETLMSKPYKR